MRLPHAPVQITAVQQFLLGSGGFDQPLVDQDNLIGGGNGGQTVGDNQQRAAFDQFRDAVLDQRFILRIGISGGFVLDDDRRVFQPLSTSQKEAISLAMVLLPEPEGPTSALTVPSRMVRLTPWSTSSCL